MASSALLQTASAQPIADSTEKLVPQKENSIGAETISSSRQHQPLATSRADRTQRKR